MSDSARYLKPKDEGFMRFVWNAEKKECFGRTGSSWAKIGIFYVIYYFLLACWFAALFSIFYTTLDPVNAPKYTYGGSLLKNPALGFRPASSDHVESTLVWYKQGDPTSYKLWADSLTNFTKPYNPGYAKPEKVRNCTFEEYNQEKDMKEPPTEPCVFLSEWLGKQKEGEPTNYCSSDQNWGYNNDSPCILLKLNKMMGWKPDVYKNKTQLDEKMPEDLKTHILGDLLDGQIRPMVWVSCEGEYPSDQEHLGEVRMYPHRGFPAFYFPYTKNEYYRSPLIAVQLIKPKRNVLINIECRLWANKIQYDRKNRLGLVHFEVLID